MSASDSAAAVATSRSASPRPCAEASTGFRPRAMPRADSRMTPSRSTMRAAAGACGDSASRSWLASTRASRRAPASSCPRPSCRSIPNRSRSLSAVSSISRSRSATSRCASHQRGRVVLDADKVAGHVRLRMVRVSDRADVEVVVEQRAVGLEVAQHHVHRLRLLDGCAQLRQRRLVLLVGLEKAAVAADHVVAAVAGKGAEVVVDPDDRVVLAVRVREHDHDVGRVERTLQDDRRQLRVGVVSEVALGGIGQTHRRHYRTTRRRERSVVAVRTRTT